MKRKLIIVIIFLTAFFNTSDVSTIFAEKFHQLLPLKKEVGERKNPDLKKVVLPESKLLNVPLINQLAEPHLKNGCEVTSLAMILNYFGVKVSKNELAQKIKKVPLNYPNNKKGNPNIGFVGDMADGPGLSVYNGPIFDLANKYMGNRVVNLTNRPFDKLLNAVSQGSPVWVITTNNFKAGANYRKWDTIQGTIYITFREHSVVITGYDKKYIYVNDPYGYKNRKINRNDFLNAWEEMGKQAIAIKK